MKKNNQKKTNRHKKAFDYYLSVFKNISFRGRARRAEYWYFVLFNLIIASGFILLDSIIGAFVFSVLYFFVALVPGIAVTVRRLHDTNPSGWWLLLLGIFIPIINIFAVIVFIVFMVRDGQPGKNKYGPNPKKAQLNNIQTKEKAQSEEIKTKKTNLKFNKKNRKENQNKNNKKWYKRWWGAAIALFFLPFFAIYYAWSESNWSKGFKILVTGGIVLFFIIGVFSGFSQNKSQQFQQQVIIEEEVNKEQESVADETGAENDEEIVGNLYRNNQYNFRIKFPEGWKIEDVNNSYLIKMATKERSVATVLVYSNFLKNKEGQLFLNGIKQYYREKTGNYISDNEAQKIIKETNVNDFSDESFKKIMNNILESILSEFEGAKIEDKKIRYLDDKRALYFKMKRSYNPYKNLNFEVKLINITYMTLYKGNIYLVGGSAPEDKFSVVKKQIESSIDSFVFESS